MNTIEFYKQHGYYRDMEANLRDIAKGKEDSRAMRAANQIRHLKQQVATLQAAKDATQ